MKNESYQHHLLNSR